MLKHLVIAAACCVLSLGALAEDGLLRKPSPHSVEKTVERFEAAVRAKGLRVFPRIDHAAAGQEYGVQMPPAIVVAFGNPKYGTPFMLQNPEAGIDFPPRAIVYQDGDGKVWLAYNSSRYFYGELFTRHTLSHPEADVAKLAGLLEKLATEAVGTAAIKP